ncbi:hypothetical protein GOV04_03140 [Candidatus Woesearchaeota archaeon]|nr:hypothetical protein [Candidatus Woesearchaeota archaeon]
MTTEKTIQESPIQKTLSLEVLGVIDEEQKDLGLHILHILLHDSTDEENLRAWDMGIIDYQEIARQTGLYARQQGLKGYISTNLLEIIGRTFNKIETLEETEQTIVLCSGLQKTLSYELLKLRGGFIQVKHQIDIPDSYITGDDDFEQVKQLIHQPTTEEISRYGMLRVVK